MTKQKWTEHDGVIAVSVTSDGDSGRGWASRLQGMGNKLCSCVMHLLHSEGFISSASGTTHQVVILRYRDIDGICTTENIRAEATRRGLKAPNPEVACLLREYFSNADLEKMGLWWIITFHDPINDQNGDPTLLSTSRAIDGRGIDVHDGALGARWTPGDGFAFVRV